MSTTPRLLVPIDGSEAADRALAWAIAYARDNAARVDVVTVLDLGHIYAYQGLGVPELPIVEWQSDLKRTVIDRALEKVVEANVASTGEVLNGPVVRTILDRVAAHPYALVVVGRSGKGAVDAALGGSVSRALSRRSPVPVVIVP
jgi:nucleotide-binding universal stress UspA family protein